MGSNLLDTSWGDRCTSRAVEMKAGLWQITRDLGPTSLQFGLEEAPTRENAARPLPDWRKPKNLWPSLAPSAEMEERRDAVLDPQSCGTATTWKRSPALHHHLHPRGKNLGRNLQWEAQRFRSGTFWVGTVVLETRAGPVVRPRCSPRRTHFSCTRT